MIFNLTLLNELFIKNFLKEAKHNMTLHHAIEKLLRQTGQPMTAKEIAIYLNGNMWYTKADHSAIKPSQITARVNDHRELFNIDRSSFPLKIELVDSPFLLPSKPIDNKSLT